MLRYLIGIIAASRVVRLNAPIVGDMPILDIIELRGKKVVRLPMNEDTSTSGIQSLFWDDRSGHLVIEPLPRNSYQYRDFAIVKSYGKDPKIGDLVWVSGWLGQEPEDFGIQKYDKINLKNGSQALELSGSDHWVIHVHGRKATYAECLRNAEQFQGLGLSQLFISHLSDPKPLGKDLKRSRLGSREWQQIQVAVEYAKDKGAKRITLFGWSLGAMFVGEYLRNTRDTNVVNAIFDSPLIDYRSTLRLQSSLSGYSLAFGDYVLELLQNSKILALIGLSRPTIPTLIRSIEVPTLVMYSQLDGYVSMAKIEDLAELNPESKFVHFVGGRHCRLYNQAPDLYRTAIADFIA